MNYDVINCAIDDIMEIIKNYNEINNYKCSKDFLENMVVSCLGYYLVLGPEIFEKLQIVLDSVKIYRCEDKDDYANVRNNINRPMEDIYENTPITTWDYKYNEHNEFVGGIPIIVYIKDKKDVEVFKLVHELCHALEGTNSSVISDDEKCTKVKFAYTDLNVYKEDGKYLVDYDNKGFSEFVAVVLENKILDVFKNLDVSKINCEFVKDFMVQFQARNFNLSRGYSNVYVLFKDFADNDEFFELIKKYYFYSNDKQAFENEYNAYGNDLLFKRLRICIDTLFDIYKEFDFFAYVKMVNEESKRFTEATNFTPKGNMLILL